MEFELEQAVAILRRTPQVLDALLRNLPEPWVAGNEGPDTWSPYDVVGHLIHGEETDWIPRARIILARGESQPFTPFDRFAMFEKSRGKSLAELLDAFTARRRESLDALEDLRLTPEKLALCGTHPEFGRVTLAQLIASWAAHDLSHLVQISRVMCKQYAGAVGPWKEFMPIYSK
ncbi:MAG TPA: DinB family protein [Candidatus Acidoferrales bacterium]|jgi:hypothetical protein|nr:DinB family protein [Candidatus Acidoferrales bacterium]